MRAIVCAATLALAITTAADAQTRNRGARAVDKALNDAVKCSTDAIARLDDGRSDASSVARAVVQECKIQSDILFNLMAADPALGHFTTPNARREWLEEMKASELDKTTLWVLEYRAALRRKDC
jgi:hypothetical protein